MTIRMWTPKAIKGDPLVSVVVASFLPGDERRTDSLMCLLYSLRAQTYRNWEAVVVHDGPAPSAALRLLTHLSDGRVRFLETQERKNQFGHPWRKWGIDLARGAYLGLSNDDNYYAPTYFEWMLSELQRTGADVVHCNMVHSHRKWAPIKSQPKRGFVDAGNWIARAELAKQTPWTDMGFAGDWTYFSALAASGRVAKVDGHLFVHN